MRRNAYSWWILGVVLCGAVYLRLRGLDWALPSTELPHFPFQPDERFTIDNLRSVVPSEGRLSPGDAHREGPFAYLFLYAAMVVSKWLGWVNVYPSQAVPYDAEYGRLMFIARAVTAIFSTLTVGMITWIVRRITGSVPLALLGGALSAAIPFEVIYAHYGRPHVIANFFLAVTLYYSLGVLDRHRRRDFILAGFFSGVSAATRYNCGPVVLVPFLFAVFDRNRKQRLIDAGLYLCVGLLIGLIVADPFLITNFSEVKRQMAIQAQYAASDEFSISQLLSLSRVWSYVSDLIPHGGFPTLWLLWMAATVFSFFERKHKALSRSIGVFVLVYTYLMAKGYVIPVFVRAVLPLMPFMTVLSVLFCSWIWKKAESSIPHRGLLIAALGLVVSPTALFTLSYVSAMSREDPRYQLLDFFQKDHPGSSIRIGAMTYPYAWFVYKPILGIDPDSNATMGRFGGKEFSLIERPTIDRQGSPIDAVDYYLLSGFEWQEIQSLDAHRAWLEDTGRYEYVTTIQNPIRILNRDLTDHPFPHDMRYPFPIFMLFKPTHASLRNAQAR